MLEIMGWWSLQPSWIYVSQRCFQYFVALWIAVEEKQYECNCCVMNGPRSFTASTATPPLASNDLFRHTRLVDQSSSSGTAGINTDYTTEVFKFVFTHHSWCLVKLTFHHAKSNFTFLLSQFTRLPLISSWKILLGWYDLVLNKNFYTSKERELRPEKPNFLSKPYFSLLHFRVCFSSVTTL